MLASMSLDAKVRIKNDSIKTVAGPKGFDPLTIGLEVQHSIHAELWAQKSAK